jgi:hypothetical protein
MNTKQPASKYLSTGSSKIQSFKDKDSYRLEKALKDSPLVGVKTYRADKYSPYPADVFYLPGETSPHKIISEGIFHNQQLLDNGLAIKA